ncbi:MAG: tetratricopeptide repeat protein [Actinomycetota bacterium]
MVVVEAHRALERADAYAAAGEYARALTEAERAIALQPHLAEAHTQRGWDLENLGSMRLSEARDAYETALQLDPADLWAALGLATVLTRFGEVEAAEELYRRVVDEAPARVEAEPDLGEALGWAQYRVGMHSAAVETLRRCAERDRSDVAVRLDLAVVLLVEGFREEALAELRSAIDDASAGTRGHLAVALDDLESTLAERPGLSTFGGNEARAMLAAALGRMSERTPAGR